MFSSKKKEDKDKKKVAVKTTESSYQIQVQQSSSSVQNTSFSSYSISATTNNNNNTGFLRGPVGTGLSFTRDSSARATTTKDWKPLSSGVTLNKGEFRRRLSEWEHRSAESSLESAKPAVPSLSTDAIRLNNYAPQPYKSAFGNSTTANYAPNRSLAPANFNPNRTLAPVSFSALALTAPVLTIKSSPNTTKRNIPASTQFLQNKVKIKVVRSKRYYDDPNSKIPTYKTSSKNRGKALVINNIVFQGENVERHGAEVDEVNITELFKQMGFKVERYRNKTEKEIKSIIENYRRNKGLAKYDINVVVIMSHGFGSRNNNSTEIATVDEKMISTTWITEQFDGNNCQSLKGKPKIFIFQCCRGDQRDIATDAASFRSPRTQADMLMAYSTIPGYVSHRDPNLGTWYVQAICNVFMEHAHDTDVEGLLKIVDDQLASIPYFESRQTSSYENRGFKKCFFHPM